ncbi:hypothetical protein MKK88_05760 [Methylobacterium sp. E-005]|uniref:hypothetical protein n=1 Tax=Methylobacterium sp. E-005 TaxID=2836549 RepID=UPI001FB98A17|nr:hypothetical protein [Methylobacterium sp. E-005]MCJ2085500.1 hypothetical protein [Methylobacterium sp. E-005]
MAYCPLSGLPVFDQGYPVDGAQLYAFDAGTTTPRTLYLTSDLDPTKVHPRPVVTSDGVLPAMWAGAGNYDVVLFGPDGGQIRRINGLRGETVTAPASGTFDPNAQLQTGDVITRHGTGSRTGFVRENGLTIGSASSIATERANADCHALFVFLWVQDPSLQVAGGRSSAGAEADWGANKTIALPDGRLRIEIGVPDMGNADVTATRGAGGLIPSGGFVLGTTGGEAGHSLTATEVGGQAPVTTSGATQVVTTAGGTAHNTIPPVIARTRYIKL